VHDFHNGQTLFDNDHCEANHNDFHVNQYNNGSINHNYGSASSTWNCDHNVYDSG
jgi:hypothetical protein